MKNILNFFLETTKLKTVSRTGWVLMKVKNPETIAEHTFRMAIGAWLLGEERNLNVGRVLKTALCHDLCEVYAGDKTPFFYYSQLPQDELERKKILMKWPRLSKKEKEKRGKRKFKEEKKSILKLTKPLDSELKEEICSTWLDFEKRISKEGKFVKQVDRIETLIQAIEYFGAKEEIGGTSWWEGTEEIVDDPFLLEFLKTIQKKFYGHVHGIYKEKKELENILDFLLKIGKLKKMPRTLWQQLDVTEPETVAGHTFTLTLMTWVFSRKTKTLNMEKLLKMALCHELPAVYTGDLITPYGVSPKNRKKRREIFKKWPRLSKKEKEKKFLQDYKKEKLALEKLAKKLSPVLRKEMIQLFEEYKTTSSPEARLLNQLNVLAVLFKGLQYQQEDKDLPIGFLWEWAFEKCDNSICFDFIEELKEAFPQG
jgi:putative hydrolase of HD superfamily